jgi:NAD(P)-dependent dehydrogenase (short-subunit alcohol dehydrogenase family)
MFTNKIVLVTGAASGIGRDAAIAFTEKGAAVVVSDLNKEGLHETAGMIKEKRKAAMVSAQKEPALAESGRGKGESFEMDEVSGDRDVDVMAVVTDISDPEQVQDLVNRVVDKYGRLDVACNNAGVGGERKSTADYTIEEWDWVMNINLRGQWLCMKHQILVTI